MLSAHCLQIPWRVKFVEWFSTVVDVWWGAQERVCRSPREHRSAPQVVGPGI